MIKKIKLHTTGISPCSYEQILGAMKTAEVSQKGIHIVTANAAMLTTAWRDPDLWMCLGAADIVTADGMSVVWAAWKSRLLWESEGHSMWSAV